MQRRRFMQWTATGLTTGALAAGTHAADGPTRILVGFGAGGSVDKVARVLAEKLRGPLQQTVLVDNKPGAAGRIAMTETKRAAPDGNTLVLCAGGSTAIQPWAFKNLGYDAVQDFTPIARIATLDFAFTVGPGAPAGDLKALVAWMKANPAKAAYATSGAGSVSHFAGLLFNQTTGVVMNHVPYRSGALAAQDLVSGVVPLMIDSPSETLELARAGKLRIIAVTGDKRSAALPEVPTLQEAGVPLVVDNFFGLYAPANLPQNMRRRLEAALAEVMRQPDVIEKIASYGLVPDYGNGEALAVTQNVAYRKWEAPVKASGYIGD